MRITYEQYLISAGLFQLIIATTYVLICISNYSFDWLNFEFIRALGNSELLQLKGGKEYDPDLTWGVAAYNATMIIVNWVIWLEGETKQKSDFTSQTFAIGTLPFLIALMLYFTIGYRNDLAFAITGSYATFSLALYLSHEIKHRNHSY